MKVALSLVLLTALVFVALSLRDAEAPQRMVLGLSVGYLMLGAWLTGRMFAAVKLPRVSGYLVFGLIVGPSFWRVALEPMLGGVLSRGMPLISTEQVERMRFIKDLAISLIAITAGGEIRIDWLRGRMRRIAALTAANVLGVAIVVFAVVLGASSTMNIFGTAEPMTRMEWIIAAALVGLIASGNSPSMAIALINECRADGPLSRTTLAVTVCKDLLIIVLFATLVAVGKGLLDEQAAISSAFLLAVGAQLVGSIALGAVMGLAMAWYVSGVKAHLVIFVIGACFMIALLGEQVFTLPGTGQHIHMEPLLMALAAGLVMENFAPEQSAPLFDTIERMSLPVYCLFFAAAGAQLDLSVFTTLVSILAVVGLVLVRGGAIWAIVSGTGRAMNLQGAWRSKLWMALTPQSGVTLALAALLLQSFEQEQWARGLFNLMLGLVAIHALVGPVLYRYALVSTGEAGAADATDNPAGH